MGIDNDLVGELNRIAEKFVCFNYIDFLYSSCDYISTIYSNNIKLIIVLERRRKIMQKFEVEFEAFCKTPGFEESGKARSYVMAIRYLCDYMDISEINIETIEKIKNVEDSIKDKNSTFYCGLLEFLKSRRQKSYLEKGFISAALKYLFEYIKG